MRCGAAAIVAAIALALPAFGQHGGSGHGGSVGHSGFGGHTGVSGSRGFSGGAARYGGYSRPTMPIRSGYGTPYRTFSQYRPAYRPGYGGYRDNNRWRHGWYGGVYGYPGWGYGYPYPYVIDPGFYDWSDTGDYGEYQGGGTSQYAPYADYDLPNQQAPQDPYPAQQAYGQSPYPYTPSPYAYSQTPYPYAQTPAPNGNRPGYTAPTAPASNEQPLTLIFKDGRKPQTMRNYMMNTSTLTVLDPSHFERIPLEEIDIAATVQLNRARGVDFAVPDGTR